MSDALTLKAEATLQDANVFKNKSFILLWVGTLFSGLSLSMFYFSEAWYVVEVLNMEASLGIIYLVGSIPRVVFMTIGGVLADRISQAKIMFVSDITKAVLLLFLVISLFAVGSIELWTLIIFALLFGVLDAFFWPASGSIIPSIVTKKQLTRANSVMQTTNQSTSIIGPMISGVIIVGFNYTGIFSLLAIMLLIGGILVAFVKIDKTQEKLSKEKESFLTSIKEGFRYVRKAPVLLAFILKTLFLNLFFTGPLVVGLPIFVKNILGGDTLHYSLLEAFLAGGMLIGSVALGLLNITKHRGMISIYAQLVTSVSFLLLSFTLSITQSIAAIIVLGIAMTVSNICAVSVIQNEADSNMIGRVMSIQTISSMGLTPISFGLTSLFLSFHISINWIMMTGAILLLLFTLFLLLRVPTLRQVN
ncbi:MFS transporter [Radiobacillus sp. PE A8.2]|uniref:MFS transporter n=1 Tax=Radiobacillus sp. PE A8.2 TaxID=3380349 RepID=UPI00388FFCEB